MRSQIEQQEYKIVRIVSFRMLCMTLLVSEILIVAKTVLERAKDSSFQAENCQHNGCHGHANQQCVIHWCSHCKTCVLYLLLRVCLLCL